MRFTLLVTILVLSTATLAYANATSNGTKSTRRDAKVVVVTNGGNSGGNIKVTAEKKSGIGAGGGVTGIGAGKGDGSIVEPTPTKSGDDNNDDNDNASIIDDIKIGGSNKTTKIDDDDQTGGNNGGGRDDDEGGKIGGGGKTGDGKCVDRARSCAAARRFCKTLRLREMMRASCSMTCGFCKRGNKPNGANGGGRRGGLKVTRVPKRGGGGGNPTSSQKRTSGK